MKFFQTEITLKPHSRGFHLITNVIIKAIPQLNDINIGQLQVFIKHTSASLSINENADPTVRMDFESYFNKLVPENTSYFKHTLEGTDDMPAHIKTAVLDTSIQIPITNGELNMGCWQGIYLCEHRNYGGPRNLVITLFGV